MAKTKDPNQQQAEEVTDVAPEVTTAPGVVERGKFLQLSENAKPFIKKYGYDSFAQFLNSVGSDGVLASKVIGDLLSEKFGDGEQSTAVGISPDSPQENNVTGKLDHSGDTPTKLKTEAQTDLAPTSEAKSAA